MNIAESEQAYVSYLRAFALSRTGAPSMTHGPNIELASHAGMAMGAADGRLAVGVSPASRADFNKRLDEMLRG